MTIMRIASFAAVFSTSISQYLSLQPLPIAWHLSHQGTEATPAQVRAILLGKGMNVVTFLGYASAEYEDPAAMQAHARRILDGLDPLDTVINAGATAQGIGAVYEIAKRRGFTTIGIVSTRARNQGVELSHFVDCNFYVNDTTWGGYLPGTTTLSPVSTALVTSSDWLIAIGGGEVVRDELRAARRLGKRLTFIAADMDHRIVQENPACKKLQAPTEYRGAAHTEFAPADLSSNVPPYLIVA
jgi:hypothetical protein